MRFRLALTAATTAVALSGCTAEPAAAPTVPPPAQPAVLLDDRVSGWQTMGWLTNEAFCIRTARTGGRKIAGQENEAVFCDPAPADLTRPGPPLLPAKPLPQLWPLDPQQDHILLVGTVRGSVTDVSVTMFGRTATAAVHRLPAPPDVHAGAYAVWLPRTTPGRGGTTLDDITTVTGRDATGQIVAKID